MLLVEGELVANWPFESKLEEKAVFGDAWKPFKQGQKGREEEEA